MIEIFDNNSSTAETGSNQASNLSKLACYKV